MNAHNDGFGFIERNSIWGFDEAMAAFKKVWRGTWRLDTQLSELRIATIAPGALF
jgi:hypothetical protein